MEPLYKRVVAKLSGEVFAGDKGFGVDMRSVRFLAEEVRKVVDVGVETAIVVGGGNILRGESASEAYGIDRSTADQIGMLGTAINALLLQASLEEIGIEAKVLTAVVIGNMAEPYTRKGAIGYLEEGKVVVFACGTGNPYFTTDTAAALRAVEIGAQLLLKGTKVDGLYSSDPFKDPSARKYEEIGYKEVLLKGLRGIDSTAVSFCMEHGLPIVVFNLRNPGNMRRIVLGERVGTYVGRDTVDDG